MSELTSLEIIRFQKLWDACLLTNFFLHPNFKILGIAKSFIERHGIEISQFLILKRTPFILGDFKNRASPEVYCFVARNIKPLYDLIDKRNLEIEHTFEIMEYLKVYEIDTISKVKTDLDIKKMKAESKKLHRALNDVRNEYREKFGRGSLSNMSFFKAKR
jgi:hypothetical protein